MIPARRLDHGGPHLTPGIGMSRGAAQPGYALRQRSDPRQRPLQRARQVERGDLQPLAGMAHRMNWLELDLPGCVTRQRQS